MMQKITTSGLLPAIVMMLAPVLAVADPVKVTTVSYDSIMFYPEHTTAAEVIALHHSRIAAEISANVTGVEHDTGERVDADDVVISLDCRSYQLQLKQAGAAHEAAMAMYNNAVKLLDSARKLRKNNNIAEELYNQREADEARLKAEKNRTWAGIKTAELAVERCDIRAPYDGYISERFISKGELAMPGTAVFEIVIADDRLIESEISAADYQSFTQGKAFSYRYQGRDYPLEPRHILPVIDRRFRTHTARLAFTAASAPSGSTGSLRWQDDAPAIPSNLVVMRNGRHGVLVVDRVDGHDTAGFIEVQNYIEGMPALIELPADTRIIDTGRHGLDIGDAIQVSN